MRDLLFLVPLGIGGAILILAMRYEFPRGESMNRTRYGLAVVLAALFVAAANALLLTMEHKFYFTLELAAIFIFFMGLAYLLPPSEGQAGPKAHGLAAKALMLVGLILGLGHAIALKFTVESPIRLVSFYHSLGFPDQ